MASQVKDFSRRLLRLSRGADGRVDPERVGAVLEALRLNPPREHRRVLRQYLRLVERDERLYVAQVEYAGEPGPEALGQLNDFLNRHYSRAITLETEEHPELLAGLRVRIGDDVWDDSALGRLERLSAATPH